MLLLCLLIFLVSQPQTLCLAQPSPDRGAEEPPDVNLRIRNQWRDLRSICPSRSFTSCKDVDRSGWTDAARTQVSDFAFHGIGAWSSFQLNTYNRLGAAQTTGGDAWVVTLRDQAQGLKFATRVFDEGDGSYTVAAVFLRPGNFTATARLYYSKCLAMQEPTGLPQGLSLYNLTRADHCYIGDKVTLPGHFYLPGVGPEKRLGSDSCLARRSHQRRLLQRQRGSSKKFGPPLPIVLDNQIWNTNQYYFKQGNALVADTCYRPHFPRRLFPTTRLFMYGDSTVRDAWWVLLGRAREKPCRVTLAPDLATNVSILNRGKYGNFYNATFCPALPSWRDADPELDDILLRCTGGMPWTTVPVSTNFIGIREAYPTALLAQGLDQAKYDDRFEGNFDPAVGKPAGRRRFQLVYLDHHACRDASHVLRDLRAVGLRVVDAMVMNMGGWCYPVMGFAQWAAHIDHLADGVRRLMRRTDALFVWRTSLTLQEHVFRSTDNPLNGYLSGGLHVMTDLRRAEFDSYAIDKLSEAGVYIWDVHALSSLGLNKHQDMVHASHPTHWVMNKDMLDTFVCPAPT